MAHSLTAVVAANALCVGVSVLGGLRQAQLASRIPPVEALREASGGQARREGLLRTVVRGLLVAVIAGGLVAAFPLYRNFQEDLGEDALEVLMQLVVFGLPLTGLGLALALPWILGPVTRLWTGLVPTRSASWHLARHTAVAKADRLARSVIPVMFAVGQFFGMMTAMHTFEDVVREKYGADAGLSGASVTSLLTMLGLALVVAVAGSVGNLLMMSRQRSAELALDGVIGATPRQQLLVPALEGVVVSVSAVLLGLLMAMVSGSLLAYGLSTSGSRVTMTVPWDVLGVTALVCTTVVVLATVLPVVRTLRQPAPKVIARLVAA